MKMKRYKMIIKSDLEIVASSKKGATEWFKDQILLPGWNYSSKVLDVTAKEIKLETKEK
jgi:predicted nucleic-acid-binding Zn-ribbon protein